LQGLNWKGRFAEFGKPPFFVVGVGMGRFVLARMAGLVISLYWDGQGACGLIYNFRTTGINRWSGLAACAKNRTPA
jgi:hypothetical protein